MSSENQKSVDKMDRFAKCVNFPQPALTCDAPPQPIHHALKPIIGKSVIGAQVVLRCQEGYTPVGDLATLCLSNQQWSAVKGHCKSNDVNFSFSRSIMMKTFSFEITKRNPLYPSSHEGIEFYGRH